MDLSRTATTAANAQLPTAKTSGSASDSFYAAGLMSLRTTAGFDFASVLRGTFDTQFDPKASLPSASDAAASAQAIAAQRNAARDQAAAARNRPTDPSRQRDADNAPPRAKDAAKTDDAKEANDKPVRAAADRGRDKARTGNDAAASKGAAQYSNGYNADGKPDAVESPAADAAATAVDADAGKNAAQANANGSEGDKKDETESNAAASVATDANNPLLATILNANPVVALALAAKQGKDDAADDEDTNASAGGNAVDELIAAATGAAADASKADEKKLAANATAANQTQGTTIPAALLAAATNGTEATPDATDLHGLFQNLLARQAESGANAAGAGTGGDAGTSANNPQAGNVVITLNTDNALRNHALLGENFQFAAAVAEGGNEQKEPGLAPVGAAVSASASNEIGRLMRGLGEGAAPGANEAVAAKGIAGPDATTAMAGPHQPQAMRQTSETATVQQLVRTAQHLVPPNEQVAIHIKRAVAEGKDSINLQLDPASLGRIDIKIEVAHDGRMQAIIAADRADTLDLLKRDQGALERSLADAGLKTGADSLSFNLRGQGQDGRQGNQPGSSGNFNFNPLRGAETADAEEDLGPATRAASLASAYRAGSSGALDIKI